MCKADQYYFSDFTIGHYKRCLDLALKNYEFICYPEAKEKENFILWRHDVDFSMHVARKLAEIENEKGVRSTYFIYPHCEFYNVLEKEVFLLVKEIQKLGHKIGLHFDSHFYNIQSSSQLDEALNKEKKLLIDFFEAEIEVFSFHNNNTFTMSCEDWSYGGLINTYAKFFKKDVGYCSDSHGIWRFSRLSNVLEDAEHRKLQVLTHPEWWQDTPMAPRQRIKRCIEGRAAKNLKYYDDLLTSMGRLNIDED
jgi:hypothetical protein